MKEFINGPYIPAIIALLGIIYFGLTYYRCNRFVDKFRRHLRNKMIEASSCVSKFLFDHNNVYYLWDGLVVSRDGKSFESPEPKVDQISCGNISPTSNLPSKGIAVYFEDIVFVKSDASDDGHILRFCLLPATRKESWKVVAVDGHTLKCEHQAMGLLELKADDQSYAVGDTVWVKQNRKSINMDCYKITYTLE